MDKKPDADNFKGYECQADHMLIILNDRCPQLRNFPLNCIMV
jgi:hypothetical protein